METDEEEKFKTLEIIGKRYLKGLYIQIHILLLVVWFSIGGFFNTLSSLQDGMVQIIPFLIPAGIIVGILNIIDIRGFIKDNRKNISLGKTIKYNQGRFFIYKVSFTLFYLGILLMALFALYSIVALRNKIILIMAGPILIGIILGFLYRKFIKPSKRSLNYKKVGCGIIMFIAILLPITTGTFTIDRLLEPLESVNTDGYKVLSNKDFIEGRIEEDIQEEEYMWQKASFLVPRSYVYSSQIEGHEHINTEYSRTISKAIAKRLIDIYKRDGKTRLIGRYSQELEGHLKKIIMMNL